MKKTEYAEGQFSWVDLHSRDVEDAKRFYGSLFGWTAKDMPTDNGPTYTMFFFNDLPTAGMGPMPAEMKATGMPSFWSSYVTVKDADAAVARVQELGGSVTVPKTQAMEHGWLAFLQDPTGAAFGVWQPNTHKGAGWVNSTGGFCWNELYTNDIDKARTFYEGLFSWTFSESHGSSGPHWSIMNAGRENGGMMKIQPEWGDVPPNWAIYFTVDSCSDALAKTESLGGKMYIPPMEIPDVGTFAGVHDPQGGRFLIIEITDGAQG